MPDQLEHICANCHSFFPDTFDVTDLGICLSDPAFEPYLDELLDKGNFAACRELIEAKRFPCDRQACQAFDEVQFEDVEDDALEQLFDRVVNIGGDVPPVSPAYSFNDHSMAWLLEHDGRLRELREIFQRYTAEERRLIADYEYHAGSARELFDQLIERNAQAHDLPTEVVALAIDPEYAPAILSVGTHEYLLGRIAEGMELLLSLVRLPPDAEDLFIIIDKAGCFLAGRPDNANAVNLYKAAAARFPDEPLFQEGLSCCKKQ